MSQQQQAKKDKHANILYSIITNKPINSGLGKQSGNSMSRLSIEDYEIIDTSKDLKRLLATLLATNISKLTAFCKKVNSLKKKLDLAPNTMREKMKILKMPIKDLPPELLSSMSANATTILSELSELSGVGKQSGNSMSMLSIEDYDIICINKDYKRILAKVLATNISNLTNYCKKVDSLKKKLDLSSNSLNEKMKLLKIPIKDLPPALLSSMSASAITLLDIPEHLMERIINDELKEFLFKYKLREWIPFNKIVLSSFSLNPNAIDFLSLPANEKYINWGQLSKNTNLKALELIKAEIMRNPNNPDIDWRALSNNPEAIEILDQHRDKIEWADFSGNTSPMAIQIIKENQVYIASRGYYRELNTYWYTISRNTSTEAINFISSPENYHNIFWNFLSANTNPKAIELLIVKERELFDLKDAKFNRLEDNEKISWINLSKNPKAISLLQRKWKEDKALMKNDIKKYRILKNKEYIVSWDAISENPNAIDLLREKIAEENKLPKMKYDRLEKIEKINWDKLSANQNAIELLEEELKVNPTKIKWFQLSKNPKAIKLLEKELIENPQNIDWVQLSKNPEAIHILDDNKDKIVWSALSENPNAGELLKDRVEYEEKLKKNIDKILPLNKLNWSALSKNPSIFTFG